MHIETSRRQRILLAIDGGATASLALQLAQRWVADATDVRVVLTAAAQALVASPALEALTGQPVRSSLFDAAHEAAMGHIELARWPDAIVIVATTDALLAAMAKGLAHDLLTTLYLATDKPVFVVEAPPSGDRVLLERRGVRFIDSTQAKTVLTPAGHAAALKGLHAVVTAGPTREPLDPVRFISNRSSGKQGFAIAEALRLAGADVTLIAGPSALQAHAAIRRIDVESAEQMLDASLAVAATADLLVAAAAVADYRVDGDAEQGDSTLTLQLTRNADILATLRTHHPQLFLVGFAAETEKLEEHARGKLARKGLNLIAANWVGPGKAFDTDDNALSVYWVGGERQIANAPKTEVARQLVRLIAERWSDTRRQG